MGRPWQTSRNPGLVARVGFLVVVLAFGVYWFWAHWSEVAAAATKVTPWSVAAAAALSAVAAWSGVPAWRDLLIGLGSRLRLRDAQRVFLMGQMGKYVPGGVWTVLAQATLARDLDVPRTRSGTASLMTILLSVVTSAGLGAGCLAVSGHEVLGRYAWVLLLVVPLVALLDPRVLVWLGALAGRLLRRTVALERIPQRTVLAAAGWLLAGQVLNGLAFHLLVTSIGGRSVNALFSIGVFSLGAAAGILVVLAPAGVGARELILAFGLATVTDAGSVALVVVLFRVVLTVVDVVLAGAAVWIGRRPLARAAADDA